jgi:hypothetical protein
VAVFKGKMYEYGRLNIRARKQNLMDLSHIRTVLLEGS